MGPTLFVHLPRLLTSSDLDRVHDALKGVTRRLERGANNWSFHGLHEGACTSSLAVVPFGTEAGQVTEPYIEEIEEAKAKLPFLPVTSLQLDNYCRSDVVGHLSLASLAVSLASSFAGLIEVGSIDVAAWTTGASGRPELGFYSMHDGAVHCVTADVMTAWINHPSFYLEI